MTLLAEPKAKLLSFDEFLALPDARGYELVDGVLTERKPMGALSSRVGGRVISLLDVFCRQTGAGHVFASDAVYRCFGSPRTGRRPDASYIRTGRLPGEQVPGGDLQIPADLVVEVVSPNDLAYDVEAKAEQYLTYGFGELWVAFPNTRTVHVRRPGEPGVILSEADTLTGQGALAGFSCPVRELFPT